MACSGRGSGMRTEWVRRMGPEQGGVGRSHAERPDTLRTSHAAPTREEWQLGRGCREDGGRRPHADRGARICDTATARGRERLSPLAAPSETRKAAAVGRRQLEMIHKTGTPTRPRHWTPHVPLSSQHPLKSILMRSNLSPWLRSQAVNVGTLEPGAPKSRLWGRSCSVCICKGCLSLRQTPDLEAPSEEPRPRQYGGWPTQRGLMDIEGRTPHGHRPGCRCLSGFALSPLLWSR